MKFLKQKNNKGNSSFINILISFLFLLITLNSFSAPQQKAFDKLLNQIIDKKVPYISVKKLFVMMKNRKKMVLLDSREKREYEISHIKNAIYIGYRKFSLKSLEKIPKNSLIIVYCSVGVRSQDIVKKIKKAGFKRVFNLYGGIFKWVNQGHPIVDSRNNPTVKIHGFDKNWGKWLKRGKKVYSK